MASPCISSDSDDSMDVLSRAAGNYNAEASLMPSVARLLSMLPNIPGIGLWSLWRSYSPLTWCGGAFLRHVALCWVICSRWVVWFVLFRHFAPIDRRKCFCGSRKVLIVWSKLIMGSSEDRAGDRLRKYDVSGSLQLVFESDLPLLLFSSFAESSFD